MSGLELTTEIKKLNAEQRRVLFAWFEEYQLQEWENDLGVDVANGKLDAVATPDEDFEGGMCTTL